MWFRKPKYAHPYDEQRDLLRFRNYYPPINDISVDASAFVDYYRQYAAAYANPPLAFPVAEWGSVRCAYQLECAYDPYAYLAQHALPYLHVYGKLLVVSRAYGVGFTKAILRDCGMVINQGYRSRNGDTLVVAQQNLSVL